jgi:hypothetical protein
MVEEIGWGLTHLHELAYRQVKAEEELVDYPFLEHYLVEVCEEVFYVV